MTELQIEVEISLYLCPKMTACKTCLAKIFMLKKNPFQINILQETDGFQNLATTLNFLNCVSYSCLGFSV